MPQTKRPASPQRRGITNKNKLSRITSTSSGHKNYTSRSEPTTGPILCITLLKGTCAPATSLVPYPRQGLIGPSSQWQSGPLTTHPKEARSIALQPQERHSQSGLILNLTWRLCPPLDPQGAYNHTPGLLHSPGMPHNPQSCLRSLCCYCMMTMLPLTTQPPTGSHWTRENFYHSCPLRKPQCTTLQKRLSEFCTPGKNCHAS